MAIEFGSRKETFPHYKVYEMELAGRPFKVEMGKMCGLSNASALIRYGETVVLCNVTMSPKPREGVGLLPPERGIRGEALRCGPHPPAALCAVRAVPASAPS